MTTTVLKAMTILAARGRAQAVVITPGYRLYAPSEWRLGAVAEYCAAV